MVEQIFGALFVMSLVTPVAALVGVLVAIAWPRQWGMHQGSVHHVPERV